MTFTGRVTNTFADGWIYGAGSVGRLPDLVARVGGERPFVLSTPSVTRTSPFERVVANRGVFAQPCQHTPRRVVLDAAAVADGARADCLIAYGGSSVVDLAKGVALVLAEGDTFDDHKLSFAPGRGATVPRLAAPKLPIIALPTTLSGAEFTGAAGITDPTRGEKELYLDPKLTPRWVVLDPELTVETPARLWAATGMKIVADAIEVTSGRRATPYTDALAMGALELLTVHLGDDDLDARTRCLFAVAMLLPNLANTGLGLVAALRHQLGAGHGVAHGEASTIVLPHVMRWNGDAADATYARIAERLEVADLVTEVEELTVRLQLPTRLRDVGVDRDALAATAEHVVADLSVASSPRPVSEAADVLPILEAAW
jgi:alcohol dehydrogenase class IV